MADPGSPEDVRDRFETFSRDGDNPSGSLWWQDVHTLLAEIDRLREQNTGLGVRIQQAWAKADEARSEHDAMCSVLDRLLDGWDVTQRVDGKWDWLRVEDADDGERCVVVNDVTPAEKAVIEAARADRSAT